MTKTKIFILGSGGMLGSDLVKVFKNDSQYEVTAFTKEKLDIRFDEKVTTKLLIGRPDIVINAAAFTNVDGSEEKDNLCFDVNSLGAKNVAKACSQSGTELVHFSTDYVFDGENGPYNETATPNPINQYGHCKYIGEKYVQKFCNKSYIIRTSWLYGLNGKNFVNTMISLKDKKRIDIVSDQIGKPTYTLDLAEATKNLIEQNCEYGIYHLINEGEMSWADFARLIFNKIAPSQVKITRILSDQYPTTAKRPKHSALLNTKRPLLRSTKEALNNYLNEWKIKNEV